MTILHSLSRRPAHAAAIALLALGASALWTADARAQVRSVQPAAPRPAPANTGQIGLPSPGGLAPATPYPAGLPPVVVPSSANTAGAAGLGTGVVNGTSATTGTTGATPLAGTGGGRVFIDNGGNPVDTGSAGNPTAVLGGPGVGVGSGIPPQPQYIPSGAGPYTVVDVARSFLRADANGDGEISPGEFSRLTIRPMPFEQMDRNYDGRISRSEYDDALR